MSSPSSVRFNATTQTRPAVVNMLETTNSPTQPITLNTIGSPQLHAQASSSVNQASLGDRATVVLSPAPRNLSRNSNSSPMETPSAALIDLIRAAQRAQTQYCNMKRAEPSSSEKSSSSCKKNPNFWLMETLIKNKTENTYSDNLAKWSFKPGNGQGLPPAFSLKLQDSTGATLAQAVQKIRENLKEIEQVFSLPKGSYSISPTSARVLIICKQSGLLAYLALMGIFGKDSFTSKEERKAGQGTLEDMLLTDRLAEFFPEIMPFQFTYQQLASMSVEALEKQREKFVSRTTAGQQ